MVLASVQESFIKKKFISRYICDGIKALNYWTKMCCCHQMPLSTEKTYVSRMTVVFVE